LSPAADEMKWGWRIDVSDDLDEQAGQVS